jgi:RNA polymerase sigma factor (sigma-70 family)
MTERDEGMGPMDERTWLTERFEEQRAHLQAVAYRMLGSTAEANDAVQETWLRLSRSDTSDVENLAGWLTTVVARICLDMLRSRHSRREESLDMYVPDPVVTREDAMDPEQEVLLSDAVGLALLVVLDTLAPAERLAFVLHDMFGVPFEEIAPIVGRSAPAARQLASRARRRVRGAAVPDTDRTRQREVVDAFFAAARGGDFDALVSLLDPDVVLRSDIRVAKGAAAVAGSALMFADLARILHPVLVNGAAGVVITADGRPVSVMGFTVTDGRIVEIEALTSPARLARLELPSLEG